MKIRSTVTILGTITGLALTAGATTLAIAAPASPAMTLTGAMVCGDGPWIGPNGINVEGAPNVDPGDDGAAYVWHNASGWHLRTTDALNVAHHYYGTIQVSPDANVMSLQPVKLDPGDKVWLTSDKVIHYDLTTYTGADGFDFTVSSCAGSKAHEALQFAMNYDGFSQDVSRIKLGPNKAHPLFATFSVYRSV